MNNPLTDSRACSLPVDGGHPHCIVGGNDELLYVCDRADDRIQVFTKTGVLQRIIPVVPGTGVTLGIGGVPGLGTAGSAWDLRSRTTRCRRSCSRPTAATRSSTPWTASLGHDRRGLGQPGIRPASSRSCTATRSTRKGNLYTGETINGRRIQKFDFVGCTDDKGKTKDKGKGKGGSCT